MLASSYFKTLETLQPLLKHNTRLRSKTNVSEFSFILLLLLVES